MDQRYTWPSIRAHDVTRSGHTVSTASTPLQALTRVPYLCKGDLRLGKWRDGFWICCPEKKPFKRFLSVWNAGRQEERLVNVEDLCGLTFQVCQRLFPGRRHLRVEPCRPSLAASCKVTCRQAMWIELKHRGNRCCAGCKALPLRNAGR